MEELLSQQVCQHLAQCAKCQEEVDKVMKKVRLNSGLVIMPALVKFLEDYVKKGGCGNLNK